MPESSPALAVTLRPPRAGDEAVCRRYHQQLNAEGFSFLLAEGTWEQLLAQVEREAAGTDLPPGRVRADFLLAEVNGVVVGRVSIRHDLNEGLRRWGGHVGYAVAPEHRRRGYATQMLTQAVARLAAEGVSPVLVTCDAGNAASEATILTCGGERDADDVLPDGRVKHRFWVDSWECAVAAYWRDVDLEDRERALARMRTLVAQRPDDDAAAHYEMGGAFDSLGFEEEAQAEYVRARELGLGGARLARLDIQQASTLRNLGRADEAVAMLKGSVPHEAVGQAREVFLALALHSAGRGDEALQVALRALVPQLPRYQRSARAYVEELGA